jgi:hypothetical protein
MIEPFTKIWRNKGKKSTAALSSVKKLFEVIVNKPKALLHVNSFL